ncbi:MAG: bifunctional phosphoribosylaminoimidazolecarboxamide formyltransferase/IMP cyclohydrolase [Deltaproteobacteria bacterium]|nr:bifunctional phosphoribosylaminoimidazolecarboxamide formyltransferase/IMP cyclohydrolase [Deltaproteobacteria bacterium]
MATIKQALISVSDKAGIVEFSQQLIALGVRVLSTGGTARLLRENGLEVVEVSDYTDFPEMLDGRVKTLHPKIHGGLLGRRDLPEHVAKMAEHNIEAIDMVVVNLYPFAETIAKPDCAFADAIENIDIGGPTMLRSAAKNYGAVTVIIEPCDYAPIIAEMQAHNGAVSPDTNFALAKKVFQSTAAYDAAIANYLGRFPRADAHPLEQNFLPETFTWQGTKVQDLRYGENPSQRAAFYRDPQIDEPCISNAVQLQGKELSFNNILDSNAAFELVKEFTEPAAVYIKHTNPCGAATSTSATMADILRRARACDPVSAFGGIVALNREVDAESAAVLSETFLEAVIAPGFSPEALATLAAKTALRLLQAPLLATFQASGLEIKKVVGGFLLQERDLKESPDAKWLTVSAREPSAQELATLKFAWKICKHVKSNAIVLAADNHLVGVGAGQMSRIDSVNISIMKALEPTAGSVLASDAFFPFRDGVDAAARAGVTAIIQPGGSNRDDEAIAAADEHNMAMIFTGNRHFKH